MRKKVDFNTKFVTHMCCYKVKIHNFTKELRISPKIGKFHIQLFPDRVKVRNFPVTICNPGHGTWLSLSHEVYEALGPNNISRFPSLAFSLLLRDKERKSVFLLDDKYLCLPRNQTNILLPPRDKKVRPAPLSVPTSRPHCEKGGTGQGNKINEWLRT